VNASEGFIVAAVVLVLMVLMALARVDFPAPVREMNE
jgi:hypothetical protein